MKNTFTVNARKMYSDEDTITISEVTSIMSNLGGFLLGLSDGNNIQLDADYNIIIDGSDDSFYNADDDMFEDIDNSIDSYEASQNMPCDTYGMAACTENCPRYVECQLGG